MNKQQATNIVFLIIVSVFMMTACHSLQQDEPIMLSDPPTPEQVFRDFYSVYLNYASFDETNAYFRQAVYRQNYFLDRNFLNMLENSACNADPCELDPITCSDEIPTTLEIAGAEIEKDRIILNIQSDQEDHSFHVVLVPKGQAYFLHEIRCE